MSSSSTETRLLSCPARPSCVCSLDARPRHAIEPFELTAADGATFSALRERIRSLPRVELLADEADHLHFVFRSRVFRFADDVEFFRAGESSTVQVRSCSRVGYYDFGVNRRRVEGLRRILREAGILR